MSARARAAQGEARVTAQSRVGSGRHGGVTEKVVEAVEVRRYWPGKAPNWAEQGANEQGASSDEEAGFGGRGEDAPSHSHDTQHGDRRLQRLSDDGRSSSDRRRRAGATVVEEADKESESESDSQAERGRRRAAAVIVEAGHSTRSGDSEDEDDDAIEARRERLLAMRRRRAQEEAEEEARLAQAGGGDSEEEADGKATGTLEEDEEESEYETDDESEDESGAPRTLMKPVFVSSTMRETIKERNARLEAEEAAKARREERIAERANESRQMLVQIIQQEEAGVVEGRATDVAEMPDDDDEVDELENFDLWKVLSLIHI